MKKMMILSVLLLTILLSACKTDDVVIGEVDLNGIVDEEDLVSETVILTEEEIISYLDDAVLNITEVEVDFDSFDEDDTEYTELLSSSETIYITVAGTYLLEGEYTSQIVINVENEDVNLILNNATLTSTDGPCILVLDADDVTISAKAGSVNTIEDSTLHTETVDGEDYNAVIYSYSDLEINGTGTINVNANYNNAIYSKDDIKISEVTLNISSVDDGIVGRDYVAIKSGNITIESSGDSIKSTNDELGDKGFVYILNGTFDFDAQGDGIQAVNSIIIYDGVFNINAEDDGIQSDQSIYIGNGEIVIDSSDDAINAVTAVVIYDGEITINAEDDAIHADVDILIEGGTVLIESCYEGLEAFNITIGGGNITITSVDDAINATAGGGQIHGPSYVSTGGNLTISGGVIIINALTGDGVDINGSGIMTGGYLIVFGPTADNQAAIDYDLTFDITGGYVVSFGYSGMILPFSDSSTQASLMYAGTTTYPAGTILSLLDETGTTLVEIQAIKSFTGVVVSTEQMLLDQSYTLELGDDTYDFETSTVVTTIGTATGVTTRPRP